MRDPAWREWYRAQHDRRSSLQGTSFEDYVTSVLSRYHRDYFNPAPAGKLGDGGCDGFAEAGTILYACYGSRAQRDAERKLRDKMRGDFERALDQWHTYKVWRFVTNAAAGPVCGEFLIEVQQKYGPASDRPIECAIWRPDDLWAEVVSQLPPQKLDVVFPGIPRAENVELIDLVPLLEKLGSDSDFVERQLEIRPVPPEKMDYNHLSLASRFEFQEGRIMAPRIEQWFEEPGLDPDLRDHQGRNFRKIYETHRRNTDNPTEILERLYTSLGGSDFRYDSKRANAVYAVTAYFFDSCHIFEEPPIGFLGGGPD